MDKIIIKDLHLFAYHGVNKEEKTKGQNFYLDLTVWLDISEPCLNDNIEDTVSYAEIIKKVSAVFTEKSYNLLEKAAEVVSDAVFKEFPAVMETKILLKKPEAPIKADFAYVAVEIRRKRSE